MLSFLRKKPGGTDSMSAPIGKDYNSQNYNISIALADTLRVTHFMQVKNDG